MSSSNPPSYLASLFSLESKTVLVTGGTRGIGAGLTIALASAGADIIFLQRDVNKGEDLKARIRSLGRNCTTYECDLTDRTRLNNVVPTICEKDGREIDILVNCGGVQHRSPAVEFPEEKWDEILSTNLTAPFLLSRALAAHWLSHPPPSPNRRPNKKIINIASALTYTGGTHVPAYASSKGGIGQLTKALSNEWMGKGICVTALAPGYIHTELTEGIRGDSEAEKQLMDRVPAARWGVPEDLAGGVVYLASAASDFVSGEIHVVDGGFCGR
ncbi:hypothetical protein MMC20_007898 [Loxospora ochrophaea]|nr:hypothetical protein [Loxospora ochrophaea]